MGKFHEQKRAKQAEVKYSYTNAQIAEKERTAYAAGVAKGVIEGIHYTLGAMCKVMNISYSYGRGRLPGLCDRILGMLSHAGGPGVISLEELKKAAFDLGDIKDIELKRKAH